MEWLVQPSHEFDLLKLINLEACCSSKTFSGPCRVYAECNGSAKLVYQGGSTGGGTGGGL